MKEIWIGIDMCTHQCFEWKWAEILENEAACSESSDAIHSVHLYDSVYKLSMAAGVDTCPVETYWRK